MDAYDRAIGACRVEYDHMDHMDDCDFAIEMIRRFRRLREIPESELSFSERVKVSTYLPALESGFADEPWVLGGLGE